MKIERGFAHCPVKGCNNRRVMFVGVEKAGGVTTVGLVDESVTHIVLTNNPDTLRRDRVYCEDHQRGFRFERLNATYNPDVECTPRCRTATRNDCECSCAGKNHGRAAM